MKIIPVVFIQACSLIGMPLMMAHRAFVTTIDVQLTSYQRFEIPSVPRFFDLRKPRSLKPPVAALRAQCPASPASCTSLAGTPTCRPPTKPAAAACKLRSPLRETTTTTRARLACE
ncbi:uncharacterized protein [Linepithema humile]|uniref:uncharacterized protein isoform X3 n=1 Tax=Linepithema humile TaxID=83485 RepID=UPI00351DBD35